MAVSAGLSRRALDRPGGRMNLRRIFANAIARRVAYVLVAAALAWLGLGEARADTHVSQGEAYAHCMSQASQIVGAESNPPGENKHSPECQGVYNSRGALYGYKACWQGRFHYGAGQWGDYETRCVGEDEHTFSQTCAALPSKPPTTFYPPSGSVGCYDGCQYTYRETGDGETTQRQPNGKVCNDKPDCSALGGNYIWNGYLNVCQPVEPECPAGQKAHGNECVKEDSCPDGMALQNGVCKREDDTCPAGQTRAPDGSCVSGQCPAGMVKGADGTCKPDEDDDGQEDEGADESFSGGDDCNTPPACSGSPILCGQARIQWRIDCNTRKKANISGGHCGAGGMPVCAGDGCKAAEHQQLIQQWKAACSLEALARDGIGGGDGGDNADLTAIKDAITGSAAADPGGEGNPSDAWAGGDGSGDEFMPDTSGYGYGNSCPPVPQIDVMGTVIEFDIGPLCAWVGLAGNIVFALAGLASLRIVASREG